jgi:hypothetical protein
MADKGGIRVNTLVIGAGRSGTTSLCSLLEGHREVCFSNIKEVHYFSIPDLYRRGEGYYHGFFRRYRGQPVVASADTYLLMAHEAIQRVHAYNPGMKIIVLLRDPVARAWSSYHYSVNYGYHGAYSDFLDSPEKEKNIRDEADIVRRNNVGHFYGSLYYEHLHRWAEVFPGEQILLLKTEDLKEAPLELTRKLQAFLDLRPDDSVIGKENPAAVPRNLKLERFLLDRDRFFRKVIRKTVPRFVKNLVIGTGLVDRLHEANRKLKPYEPLPGEKEKEARLYFEKDLRLLKQDFQVDLTPSVKRNGPEAAV